MMAKINNPYCSDCKKMYGEILQLKEEIATFRKCQALGCGYNEMSAGVCLGCWCKKVDENKRLREALEKIAVESGKVDISNWPAQQQICQAIARQALQEETSK